MIKSSNSIPCAECRLNSICRYAGRLETMWNNVKRACLGADTPKLPDEIMLTITAECHCQHFEAKEQERAQDAE